MERRTDGYPGKGNCPAATICPFRTICALYADESTEPLHPQTYQIEKGEVLVTNPGSEHYIYIFQTGLFATFGESEHGEEVPFALYGEGVTAGVAELFTPPQLSDTYHIRSLFKGNVCTLATDTVQKKLLSLPQEHAHRVICCALMNQFTSVFALMKIRGRPFMYDQILSLLLYLRELSLRKDSKHMTFEITQEEIALLVSANRTAISRVLKKMQSDGLISYSYKSITLNVDKLPKNTLDFLNYYLSLDDEVGFVDNYEVSYLSGRYPSETA